MELPLRLQALQLAAAFALGAALGVVYDLLRALRRRVPALTAAADVLFCLLLLVGLLALALYAGGGLLRLFFFPGIALGAWAYFRTLGRLLLPAFSWVFSAIGRVFHLILAPGKIFLKKCRIFFKKSFASVKKWFTIFSTVQCGRDASAPERSAARNEIRPVVSAGQARDLDRGGVRRRDAGVAAQPDRGQKRGGKLEEAIANADSDEGVTAIAREKLGMVSNGEIVFKDVGD